MQPIKNIPTGTSSNFFFSGYARKSRSFETALAVVVVQYRGLHVPTRANTKSHVICNIASRVYRALFTQRMHVDAGGEGVPALNP